MVSIRSMISSIRCCYSWLWPNENEKNDEDEEEEDDNANIDDESDEMEDIAGVGVDEDDDGSFMTAVDRNAAVVLPAAARCNYSKPRVFCRAMDEELLQQLSCNDPDIDGLYVDGDFWVEGAGRVIGKNTCLRVLLLRIHAFDDVEENSWLGELCRELSHNRSIEWLSLFVTSQLRLDIFRILAPFLEHNSQLRCITLDYHENPQTFNSLVSALSSCKIIRLECIDVFSSSDTGIDGVNDEQATKFFEALSHHCYLTDLAYGGPIERMGSTALANVLKSSSANLVKLLLMPIGAIDDECVTIIGDALTENCTLISIDIYGDRLNAPHTMTKSGWAIFCRAISRSMTLKNVRLGNCHMLEFELTSLTNAVAASQSITELHLNNITSLSPRAWREFSKWLTNPCATITRLSLTDCAIERREIISILSSLLVNTSISELDLTSSVPVSSEVWESLSRLLCDATSIDNTYSSNHTLHTLTLSYYPGSRIDEVIMSEIISLLKLNETKNKVAVARRKVIDTHFAGEVTANHPLAGLPDIFLPQIWSWFGRDELGFSALYFAVRGFYGGCTNNTSHEFQTWEASNASS